MADLNCFEKDIYTIFLSNRSFWMTFFTLVYQDE